MGCCGKAQHPHLPGLAMLTAKMAVAIDGRPERAAGREQRRREEAVLGATCRPRAGPVNLQHSERLKSGHLLLVKGEEQVWGGSWAESEVSLSWGQAQRPKPLMLRGGDAQRLEVPECAL